MNDRPSEEMRSRWIITVSVNPISRADAIALCQQWEEACRKYGAFGMAMCESEQKETANE